MADTMSHLRNMKRRFTQGNSQGDLSPAEKVDQLENTLNVFRAEVDMKLKIMQQILTTRNEQVTVQKKLLEREQTLYDTLLGHWKNTPKLAATGLSVNFSAADIIGGEENEENLSDPDYMEGDEPGPSRKKSKSSLRRQRKSGKPMPKQHKMKLQAQQDEGAGAETKGADDGTFQQEEGDNGDGTFTNTDDQDQDNEWDVELEPRSPPVQVQMKNEVEDEEDVSNFDEFNATFELLPSRRGGSILSVNNYLFHKRGSSNQGVDYFYCATSKCKSSVQINSGQLELESLKEVHEHPNDADKIKALKLVPSIRKRAAEEPQLSIPKIYREELKKLSQELGEAEVSRLPTFKSLHSTLYRDRSSLKKAKDSPILQVLS